MEGARKDEGWREVARGGCEEGRERGEGGREGGSKGMEGGSDDARQGECVSGRKEGWGREG